MESAKQKTRNRHILLFFNLAPAEWYKIAAYQENRCVICGRSAQPGKHLNTDHSHKTGLVRGLLCTICNRLLGKIESQWPDTIRLLLRLLDYLKDPPAVKALGKEVLTFPGRLGTKRHRAFLKKTKKAEKHALIGALTRDGRDSKSDTSNALDNRLG